MYIPMRKIPVITEGGEEEGHQGPPYVTMPWVLFRSIPFIIFVDEWENLSDWEKK